jgi:allantoate deiminase
LHDRGQRLPYALEVVAFADEEGLRFGTTFLGSSVYVGAFEERLLGLEDGDGVTLAEAVRAFGGDPESLVEGDCEGGDLLGYCEVHIEQGPVLEDLDLPVGVVAAINGQSRLGVGFAGEAGHAGTVPMETRRDALCAAGEFVLEVERAARREPGSVATVGEISALPGASNVIPGEAELSLDLRNPDDAARERLRDNLEAKASEIAASRGCEHRWQVRQETPAVPMDSDLSTLLERAGGGVWRAREAAFQRGGARRGTGGRPRPRRHAFCALREGHKPQPRRVCRTGGRGRGDRGDERLHLARLAKGGRGDRAGTHAGREIKG